MLIFRDVVREFPEMFQEIFNFKGINQLYGNLYT